MFFCCFYVLSICPDGLEMSHDRMKMIINHEVDGTQGFRITFGELAWDTLKKDNRSSHIHR